MILDFRQGRNQLLLDGVGLGKTLTVLLTMLHLSWMLDFFPAFFNGE